MQEAAVVLSILRERGRKGLPLTQLDRQMFNKDLYLLFVDRTSGRHAGVVDVLAGRWPVELTRLFRREDAWRCRVGSPSGTLPRSGCRSGAVSLRLRVSCRGWWLIRTARR